METGKVMHFSVEVKSWKFRCVFSGLKNLLQIIRAICPYEIFGTMSMDQIDFESVCIDLLVTKMQLEGIVACSFIFVYILLGISCKKCDILNKRHQENRVK